MDFQIVIQKPLQVKKLKSYVKDATDLIKNIEAIDHVNDESYLVSLDVRSLCTYIPHKVVIEAVKRKLKKSKPSISLKIILTFLKVILTLNKSVFVVLNYLQKNGCAMYTKCEPSCENIFLHWFEKKFLFPLPASFNDCFPRFIDDIFLIQPDTKTEFDKFLKNISDCHPSIKLEHKMSKTEIDFVGNIVVKVHNNCELNFCQTNRQTNLFAQQIRTP